MVLCAKSTIGRRYSFCFVQHVSIFCHGSIFTVFNDSFVLFPADEIEIVALRVVAAVCLPTQTQHFSASKFFVEQPSAFFKTISVISTKRTGKNMLQVSEVNKVLQVSYVAIPTFGFSQFPKKSNNSFPASTKYSDKVPIPIPSLL